MFLVRRPHALRTYLGVDLIISHWPKSLRDSHGFLGCPELRAKIAYVGWADRVEIPEFFDLNTARSESGGNMIAADLQRRSSRRTTLDELIGSFTFRHLWNNVPR